MLLCGCKKVVLVCLVISIEIGVVAVICVVVVVVIAILVDFAVVMLLFIVFYILFCRCWCSQLPGAADSTRGLTNSAQTNIKSFFFATDRRMKCVSTNNC